MSLTVKVPKVGNQNRTKWRKKYSPPITIPTTAKATLRLRDLESLETEDVIAIKVSLLDLAPNGWRLRSAPEAEPSGVCPFGVLVISTGSIRRGGTRQRRFDGTNFKLRKMPENAQTPTSRVHAVLGCALAE